MNIFVNKPVIFAVLFSLAPFVLQTAQAVSSFENSVNVTYTIDSIDNLTNPGSTAGLNIFGQFSPGAVTGNNGFGGSVVPGFSDNSAGNVYDYTISLNGEAGVGPDGFSGASLEALMNLFLENTGTDEYDIQVTLVYSLMSKVFGDKADSVAALEYAGRPPRRGQNVVTDNVFAEIGGVIDDSTGGSSVFQINLPGGGPQQAILATASVNGSAGVVVNNVPETNILLLLFISWFAWSAMGGKRKYYLSA